MHVVPRHSCRQSTPTIENIFILKINTVAKATGACTKISLVLHARTRISSLGAVGRQTYVTNERTVAHPGEVVCQQLSELEKSRCSPGPKREAAQEPRTAEDLVGSDFRGTPAPLPPPRENDVTGPRLTPPPLKQRSLSQSQAAGGWVLGRGRGRQGF